MNCDCIEKIKGMIKTTYPKFEQIELSGETFQLEKGTIIMKHSIGINYKKKKKDGTVMNKTFTMPAIMKYCPFCGEKYNYEEK